MRNLSSLHFIVNHKELGCLSMKCMWTVGLTWSKIKVWKVSNEIVAASTKNNRWRLSVRLQSVHREPIGARSTERQDQRGEYEAVPEAEKSGGERSGQVQPESRRHGAGLRHLRESGRTENVCLKRDPARIANHNSVVFLFLFLCLFLFLRLSWTRTSSVLPKASHSGEKPLLNRNDALRSNMWKSRRISLFLSLSLFELFPRTWRATRELLSRSIESSPWTFVDVTLPFL